MVMQGVYPSQKENPVPCSDAAGEVISVGAAVKNWIVGDRVISNLNPAYLNAGTALTADIQKFALGSDQDGVLTEYRTFPAEVRFLSLFLTYKIS